MCLLGGYACAKAGFKADKNGVNLEKPTFNRDYKGFMDAAKAENLKFKKKVGGKISLTGCYSF